MHETLEKNKEQVLMAVKLVEGEQKALLPLALQACGGKVPKSAGGSENEERSGRRKESMSALQEKNEQKQWSRLKAPAEE